MNFLVLVSFQSPCIHQHKFRDQYPPMAEVILRIKQSLKHSDTGVYLSNTIQLPPLIFFSFLHNFLAKCNILDPNLY